MTLAEAAAQADALAERGDERALADLRAKWEEEVEHAARSQDYRERAVAYRAIAQFRFRQKIELLRRGLEDESPACRGSAVLSLESLSRDHPGAMLLNNGRSPISKIGPWSGLQAMEAPLNSFSGSTSGRQRHPSPRTLAFRCRQRYACHGGGYE